MNQDHVSQYTQSQTPYNHEPNPQLSSNQSLHIMNPEQLQLIQEIEEEQQQPQKQRLRLSLDSDRDRDRESVGNQWIKQRPGSSSPSDQKTVKNITNKSGSQALVSGNGRSSKTPQDFQEEIIPQVRSILKQGTFISHSSLPRSRGLRPSRLQSLHSLPQSIKKNRVYPEEVRDNIGSNQNDSFSDDSFFEETEQNELGDETRYRFDKRYANLKYIIFPDDPTKLFWDILVVIALLYICIMVPYDISFKDDNQEETPTQFGLGLAIDLLYGIDIIINFFSAYVDDQDELIVDKTIIIKHYLKSWFILDLVCVVPLDYILDNNQTSGYQKFAKLPKAYKMIKLVKMSRMLKFCVQKKKFGELITSFSNITQNIRVMLISLFSVILVSHLFSCFWYFIGTVSSESETWITHYVEDQTNFERYIMSLYWVFQTMATTGYGDISATNSTEQMIAIFIMIIGVVFFSVTIGSVSSLLTQLDTQNLKYKEKIDTLNEITKNHKIDNALYAKICKVLKQGYKNNQNEVVEFLHLLPQNLRTELSQAMYKNVFLGIDLFKQKPLRFTAYIGPLLTILRIPEGDVIYNEGDYASEIYFIREGSVSLCIKECDYHPFVTIDTGQYFGEIELIKETQRKYTAIAQKQSELLALSKSHFFKIFFSEFREIGEELHEDARRKKRDYEDKYTKTKAYLQGLEQKAEQQIIEDNNQPKPKLGLEKFKKNLIFQAQTKRGFLDKAIKDAEQLASSELKRKMTKLKTVLLQKGIINKFDENSPTKISPKMMKRNTLNSEYQPRKIDKRNTFLPMEILQQAQQLSSEDDNKQSQNNQQESNAFRFPKKAMTAFISVDQNQQQEEFVTSQDGMNNSQHPSSYNTNIQFLKKRKKQLYL
ncbi:unnamed protein product [Paramecium octaurelia]|uniref:Cyclic nucleotide-binding domain-containing protein n=1 Tax=Paramecium octaurelia TaxID=43137 RepID=A0A8S1TTK7_PAROT|nr:unnamed protein product [Paramecium octaurelia]